MSILPGMIRRIGAGDRVSWLALRRALFPECPDEMHDVEMNALLQGGDRTAVFGLVAEPPRVEGLIEVSVRDWAEACHSGRVGYIESWYVAPRLRGTGGGRALMKAAELWARERGCLELASDTDIENIASLAAHRRLGFEVTGRLITFRKSLTD